MRNGGDVHARTADGLRVPRVPSRRCSLVKERHYTNNPVNPLIMIKNVRFLIYACYDGTSTR